MILSPKANPFRPKLSANSPFGAHGTPWRLPAQCFVARMAGPSYDRLIMSHMTDLPLPTFEQKIVAPKDLAARVAQLPRPIVFTNGCFDILHRGHVTYLAQARALGTSLIVAANTDASVKRLGKGDDRPMNPLENRMAVLAALECVSLVTWFDEDTPIERILDCKPDILVKGGDWAVDNIVGAPEVRGWGGKVVSIPFLHETSTTALVNKIRST